VPGTPNVSSGLDAPDQSTPLRHPARRRSIIDGRRVACNSERGKCLGLQIAAVVARGRFALRWPAWSKAGMSNALPPVAASAGVLQTADPLRLSAATVVHVGGTTPGAGAASRVNPRVGIFDARIILGRGPTHDMLDVEPSKT
jgi:hypothetical protein